MNQLTETKTLQEQLYRKNTVCIETTVCIYTGVIETIYVKFGWFMKINLFLTSNFDNYC